MKLKKILLTAVALLAMSATAQTLPPKCEAYLPSVLNKTTIYKADVEKLASTGYGQTGSTGKHWDAYSDRCDNALYSSPGGSKNGKTLSFNQKVRIAKIQSNYALVYTEHREGAGGWPAISGSAECQGWIPMSNLLLWGSCPTNEYGIFHKALIVYNIDQQKDANLGVISWHPDPANTSHTAKVKASVDFHYIMKEENSSKGKRYLLASVSKISESTTERVLEGWVSSNTFSPWNQRTCLEPNWDNDAVSYFVSQKEQAVLFEDPKLTQRAQAWTYGEKNKEGQASTQYRMPPRSMRFPILDNDAKVQAKTFKITAFGTPQGGLGINDVSGQIDEQRKLREQHLNTVSHVNVIVVMDATSSMKKYFPVMAEAVKEATQFLQGDVTVGAVLYRDYPDGDNAVEYCKVTKPTDPALQSFLTNVGRNNYGAFSKATTAHEAMYLGLKTAFDYNKMGYKKDQTNVFFIVGDCGNNPSDTQISADEIKRMAHEVEAQLFSFQVVNQDKEAWEDFNLQLNDIFIDQVKYLYTSLDKNAKIAWRNDENSHGYRVKTNTTQHFWTSETHRAQVGKELSERELLATIKDSYISFKEAFEQQKKAINDAGADFDGIDQNADKNLTTISINDAFLRRKLGPDYAKIIKPTSLLAYNGYACQDNGNGRDYWQAVVFLSSEELVELIKRLEPLKVASKTNSYGASDRNNYVKAITGIITSMTEISPEELDNLSTDDVTRIIGGLNATTPMLRGSQTEKVWKLGEIKNPQACSDEDFKKILKKMENKIDNLSQIPKSTQFKYYFEQNGHKSYWVPLYMIP